MTITQIKALTILKEMRGEKYLSAKAFSVQMWPGSDMHVKTSNQGNGACHGKAAWLQAGSYLGKLIKKGWVRHEFKFRGFQITDDGIKELNKSV